MSAPYEPDPRTQYTLPAAFPAARPRRSDIDVLA